MRKFLFLLLFFMFIAGFKYAYCQDNLLAVDVIAGKQNASMEINEEPAKDENAGKTAVPVEVETPLEEETGRELEKIRTYRELLDNKKKELEIIRLDLEKSNLLLKKKEAEKEIFQIDKVLPHGKEEEVFMSGSLTQGANAPLVDASDIKIQFLVIADNLKEGQISLKGAPFSFKEGERVASKLTVERIDSDGVVFKQSDGSVFKLNFIN